ncbi:MAG: hypothetical protein ACKPKO_13255, partial [Candidatus Fonsibacter sp.]
LKEEMPMENMKQKVSDFAHNVAVIVLTIMFTFGNTVVPANALIVKPKLNTEQQNEKRWKSSAILYTSLLISSLTKS